MPSTTSALNKILSLIKYIVVAGVVFTIGTQLLINTVPYNQIIVSINQTSKNISNQLVSQIAVDIDGTETEGDQSNLSFQTLILSSLISAFISIFVIALIAGIQVLLILSVVVAIIGTLILSQNRGLLETVLLVVGFFVPRQRKHWGTVFDQETNLPISFATIRLNKAVSQTQSELITQAIADLDGKYRIYLPKDTSGVAMQVKAAGYKDYIKSIDKIDHNEIIDDIPMIKSSGSEKTGFRLWLSRQRATLAERFTNYLLLLSIGALAVSIYNLITVRNIFGYAGVVIYGLSVIWNITIVRDRMQTSIGKVVDVETKQPIESAFVKVFYSGQTLISGITDSAGVVKLNIQAGTYEVEVTKAGLEMVGGHKLGNTQVIKAYVNDKGYLTKSIFMQKSDKLTGEVTLPESDASLMNPFS